MKGFAIGSYVGAIFSVLFSLYLYSTGHMWTATEALFCYTEFMLCTAALGLLIETFME